MTDPVMNVGFVGLGDQGFPMARRILDAGFPLAVYARISGVVEPLVADGATAATSVADLAARSDVFAVCVGDDADVSAVLDEALPALRSGSIVLIHSTVLPATCTSIADQATAHGVRVLDAPVSGGRARAFDGALTVMVGGDADTLEAVRPVLEACATMIVHVGPLGAGQVLKLINNAVFTAQVAVTDEVLTLIQRFGLDPVPAMTALAASTGSSRCLEMCVAGGATNTFPRHSDGRRRGAELLAKDVVHFRDVAVQHGVDVPRELAALVASGLSRALAAGEAEPATTPSRSSGTSGQSTARQSVSSVPSNVVLTK